MSEHDSSRLHRLAWYSHSPSAGEAGQSEPKSEDRQRPQPPAPDIPAPGDGNYGSSESSSSSVKRQRPETIITERPSRFRRPSEPRPSSAVRSRAVSPVAQSSSPPSTSASRAHSPAFGPIRLPPFSALTSGASPYSSGRRVSSESEGGQSSRGRFAYGGQGSSSPRSASSGSSRRRSGLATANRVEVREEDSARNASR